MPSKRDAIIELTCVLICGRFRLVFIYDWWRISPFLALEGKFGTIFKYGFLLISICDLKGILLGQVNLEKSFETRTNVRQMKFTFFERGRLIWHQRQLKIASFFFIKLILLNFVLCLWIIFKYLVDLVVDSSRFWSRFFGFFNIGHFFRRNFSRLAGRYVAIEIK